jgi:PLP dependent protein
MPISKNRIEKNLGRIRENIAAGCERSKRSADEVALVAVTKAVELESIKHLVELGVTDLGESRVQQLVTRAGEVAGWLQRRRNGSGVPVRWHMIGRLQRNKVKAALEVAEVLHSVDSLRLAEEIDSRAERAEMVAKVLLEVNCSEEPQKGGVAVGAAAYLGELVASMKHTRLVGLMTMAPLVEDPERARPTFVRLRELFEEMRHKRVGGENFRHLSMGMSQDYSVAVEEGATMVRIGTALFE